MKLSTHIWMPKPYQTFSNNLAEFEHCQTYLVWIETQTANLSSSSKGIALEKTLIEW